MHRLSVVFLLLGFTCVVSGIKILGIFHIPAYSHFSVGDRIFRELAARGHEVTVIAPFELKKPVENLKHVVITGIVEEMDAIRANFIKSSDSSIAFKLISAIGGGLHFSEFVLKHPNIQNLLKSNQKFDLVIYENFFNEVFTGFAHHYGVPYVLINSIGPTLWANSKMGNPNNPAYVPDLFLTYSSQMNFWERLQNSVVYLECKLVFHLYGIPKHNELLQKYFPGAPHLLNLMYNSSLMLLNSNPIIGAPYPLLPNMIEIGGYLVQPPKPLPKDLQDYLDTAKDGVIYFSLGSHVNLQDLEEEKISAILKSLGNLKQKVLWKWDSDTLPGKPPNVRLEKWLPQSDVLAHPNLKLFISHGGLLSTIEAIYHGVPILGIPLFADQGLNIGTAEKAGYAIGVPFDKLTETVLTTALNEMLYNNRYTTNVKHRSNILKDQQTNPLDRAIYWIEYVVRHQGAPHLRSAASNLEWYQYLLLDVAAGVGLTVLIVTWVLYRVIKFCCCGKSKHVNAKKKLQ